MPARSVRAFLVTLAIVAAGSVRAEALTLVCATRAQAGARPEARDIVLRIDTSANTIAGTLSGNTPDFRGPVKITDDAMKWEIDVRSASGSTANYSGVLNRVSGQGSITLGMPGSNSITYSGPCRKAQGKAF